MLRQATEFADDPKGCTGAPGSLTDLLDATLRAMQITGVVS
jgi:hypothetical protein